MGIGHPGHPVPGGVCPLHGWPGALGASLRRGGADGPLVVENDGATLRYGPGFEQRPLAIQTRLVAHEVLHVALRHAPRYLELRRQLGDVDLELANICADAIVNSTLSHLSWLELESPVLLEDLLGSALKIRQDLTRSLLEWDLERLYLEASTLVSVGDDQVRRVECFEPGRSNLREIQFQGGGGTDFSPLLEEAGRWGPDLAVFLTDLDGPAHYRPAFPVLWAVPSPCAAMPHPFGPKLVLA